MQQQQKELIRKMLVQKNNKVLSLNVWKYTMENIGGKNNHEINEEN